MRVEQADREGKLVNSERQVHRLRVGDWLSVRLDRVAESEAEIEKDRQRVGDWLRVRLDRMAEIER